jgi:Leucine-rich repeat (LRR) protein
MIRKILIIISLVMILSRASSDKICRIKSTYKNRFEISVYDCDNVSFKNLSLDSDKIEKFNAWMKENHFSTIDDQMFRKMVNLKKLWLTKCEIESVDEYAFSSLTKLVELYLDSNKIEVLHDHHFRELGNLEVLALSENKIAKIPARLFANNLKLRTLLIHTNKIKEIPNGLFEKLPELEELSIGNELEIIRQETFQQNKKLARIDLGFNKIYAIAEGTFDGLTKLRNLDLANNTCINKEYGNSSLELRGKPINFTEVSADLESCYRNFKKYYIMSLALEVGLIVLSVTTILLLILCYLKSK